MTQSADLTRGDRLRGRSALITGASRGIGFAIAESFAMQGADLVLSASSEPGLIKAKNKLIEYGGEVSYIAADVSSAKQIDDLFAFALESHAELDILVNNAGGPPPGLWSDWDRDDFLTALNSVMSPTGVDVP